MKRGMLASVALLSILVLSLKPVYAQQEQKPPEQKPAEPEQKPAEPVGPPCLSLPILHFLFPGVAPPDRIAAISSL